MYVNSDVQKVFSGYIAKEWEVKSKHIKSIDGNDNMMIPIIKHHMVPSANILEVGCGTGKLLNQDKTKFQNTVKLVNCSVEDFIPNSTYNIIVMKQVLHHVVSRKNVLSKLCDCLKRNGVIIIMTPNDGYQKSILPFNFNSDLLRRISDLMIREYIEDLPLQVKKIKHVNSVANFSSLYDYFMFLYSIGSLQKIYDYKDEYEYALKFVTIFENLFNKKEVLTVNLDYSYITLEKTEL